MGNINVTLGEPSQRETPHEPPPACKVRARGERKGVGRAAVTAGGGPARRKRASGVGVSPSINLPRNLNCGRGRKVGQRDWLGQRFLRVGLDKVGALFVHKPQPDKGLPRAGHESVSGRRVDAGRLFPPQTATRCAAPHVCVVELRSQERIPFGLVCRARQLNLTGLKRACGVVQ